jgi:hypothetical protein
LRESALHWYFVLIRVLAALTFYRLCRDLGRSARASAVAAVLYAISGVVGSLEWPQMVNGVVWAPLVFMFQLRVAEHNEVWRSSVLSGFFAGVLWLCGHHQVPTFIWVAWVFIWLYLILRKRRLDVRISLAALAAGIVGLLVGAFQTIPMAEYGRLARRYAGDALRWNDIVPYAIHEQYNFKPLSLLGIFVPGIDFNISAFIGLAGFAFALIGGCLYWRDLRVRILAALGLGAILFSMGANSVMHGILYSLVPMVEKARVPAQGMLLFQISACALVSFGFDAIEMLSRRAATLIVTVLFAAAALIFAGGLFLYLGKQLELSGDNRFMITALSAVVTGAILYGWTRESIGPGWATAVLLVLMLIECGNVTGYYFPHQDDRQRTADLRRMAEDSDIVEFLRSEPGLFRIDHDGDDVAHNFGEWWGVESYGEYVASVPDRLFTHDMFSARTQALFGIRYFIGRKAQRDEETLIYRGASGRNVYAVPGSFPRSWAVHDVRQVKPAEAIQVLRDSTFDLRTRTFITQPAQKLDSCAGDRVEITRHFPNDVALNADMKCRGMVILSDAWFPGWNATVDGRAVPILDAYSLLRGVVVDRGAHVIEMQYRPASVIAGATASILGTLIAVGFWLAPRRLVR